MLASDYCNRQCFQVQTKTISRYIESKRRKLQNVVFDDYVNPMTADGAVEDGAVPATDFRQLEPASGEIRVEPDLADSEKNLLNLPSLLSPFSSGHKPRLAKETSKAKVRTVF